MNDSGQQEEENGRQARAEGNEPERMLRFPAITYHPGSDARPPLPSTRIGPAGCLLQAQLRHFHHAESARLPKAEARWPPP